MSDVSVPLAAGAGVGAAIVSVLGVEPQALVYGFIGASIGFSFAPSLGRFRATCLFVAVVMACALLGTWGAVRFFESSTTARNGVSLILAIVFHPLLSALVANVPSVMDSLLRKIGAKQ